MKYIFILLLNLIAAYGGLWIQNDKIIQMPGGLIPIEERIILDESYEVMGGFSSVFIYSLDEHTLLLRALAQGVPGVEVIDQAPAAIALPGRELNLRGQILYDASITASLIQAFQAANLSIETEFQGLRVVFGVDESPIRIGDLLTRVDTTDITSIAMFIEYVKDLDTITLNDTHTISRREDGLYGLTLMEEVTITSTQIGYKIVSTNVQGGSGGLLQTLSLYNRLVEVDITNGARIAGTGTMSVTGVVGPIGGVRQKVIAAAREDVDIFLVPMQDYAAAKAELDQLDTTMVLIPVATFNDALQALTP
jgi:PDZ domain-containing secreted protein